ncbi:MAG: hypothetical protein Unbinned2299contig1001_10 [Prokaryotic dsDNA virus sp.]|nr:MAG: hypothetical protein Unbinned2299contig1001_10 [Prokaryotic dsDNA virus sp.]|tara:strand:+ start:7454 stop:7801 length:348 start_codon:yes stop_codon:yes gene_type:complete
MIALNFDKISDKSVMVVVSLIMGFSLLMSAYVFGVSQGFEDGQLKASKECDPVKIEVAQLKEKLIKSRAGNVAECAQQCANKALSCESICTQKIEESLKLCSEIACGEAVEVKVK